MDLCTLYMYTLDKLLLAFWILTLKSHWKVLSISNIVQSVKPHNSNTETHHYHPRKLQNHHICYIICVIGTVLV